MEIRWWRGALLTLGAYGFVGYLTLRSAPALTENARDALFLCLAGCRDEGLRDGILNVLLFLPLGAAFRLWRPRLPTLLYCLLTTCLIELLQTTALVGRFASLRDILTNMLGAWLGILLAEGWRKIVLPPAGRASRAGALALALGVAIPGLTAEGLGRALPATTWWGQWAPELGQFSHYRGTVLSARINGLPVPSGRLANSAGVRAALGADRSVIEVEAVSGPVADGPAPIFSIFDEEQREVLLVGQSPTGWLFYVRNGMARAGLRGQTVWLTPLPGDAPGDTVSLRAELAGGRYAFSARSRGRSVSTTVAQSVGWGWNAIWPLGVTMEERTSPITPLWLAGLLLPAAWWFGMAGDRRAPIWLAAAVTMTLLLFPAMAHLPAAPWTEWLGSVGGATLGLVAGRAMARRLGSGRASGGRA